MPTDHERRYVCQPKPESRLSTTRKWFAYDPDGKYRDIVTLTNDSKRRHELRGWTFKPRWP